METSKGFLADFINKKLTSFKLANKSPVSDECSDFMKAARYNIVLNCLQKNSRQDLKEIIRLSPPGMSERQVTEEFLKDVSCVADSFADDFVKGVEAIARIVYWNDNKSLEVFPDQFIPELDSAIKEIFPDTGLWGNIAWDAIIKRTEKFLADNYQDTVTLAVYSRAVSILIDHENKVARMFFESFRNDVVKAMIVNIVQPLASILTDEISMDGDKRRILLDKLYMLQSSLLAA